MVFIGVINSLCISLTHAEPYDLVAGSSSIGFRENDKQNVNIGFKSAFNALLSSENMKCDFQNYGTSEELAQAISKGQVNAFFGSPIEFLRSELYLMPTPLVSGVFSQKLKSKIILVVRKDSDINALEQLKGKKLSTQKTMLGDMGILYIDTLLMEHQLQLTKKFFSEIQVSEKSNTALVDLFFKKVDAALLSESQFEIAAELNPQIRQKTRVLEASEPYLTFVAALTKGTPEQAANSIKNSLLTVNNTTKGRNILSLMKFDGFKEINISDLDDIRKLIEKNKQLKEQQHVH